jgi:hypothetical protein
MAHDDGSPPLDRTSQAHFRNAAAFVARVLIRARAVEEPRFLSKAEFARWGLSGPIRERRTTLQLLEAVADKLEEIQSKYMEFCESGGFSCPANWDDEGDVGALKIELASSWTITPD